MGGHERDKVGALRPACGRRGTGGRRGGRGERGKGGRQGSAARAPPRCTQQDGILNTFESVFRFGQNSLVWPELPRPQGHRPDTIPAHARPGRRSHSRPEAPFRMQRPGLLHACSAPCVQWRTPRRTHNLRSQVLFTPPVSLPQPSCPCNPRVLCVARRVPVQFPCFASI